MTEKKYIKVQIPAQTVEVDVAAWALAYGVDERDVREDVKSYFRSICAEQVAELGLGRA